MFLSNTLKIKANLVNAAVLVVLLLAGALFVGPRRNYLTQLKKQHAAIQNEIVQIESNFSDRRSLQEGIKSFEEKMAALNSKFPAKEEESLGLVSELARKRNIQVLSVKSSPKAFFMDENQQQVMVDGKICHKILISVDMKSTYEDLIDYIKALKDSLPAYVTVENLRINKDLSATSAVLNISLDINLYLLS
ncbi:MAG: hypothetical protein A2Z88_11510 [Omnitrophica WOR_2 bacterium GWA2_47_8]|nr:MAG: hypothetical protein A2Z88_11510 [Omnitrophica WOR_2 bacterium GWA2_47_8]